MKSFWEKIRAWFSRSWDWTKTRTRTIRTYVYPEGARVRPIAKYVGSLLLITLALVGTILFVRSRDKDNNRGNSNDPEIAQVYEPSIGTPLAPDTNGGAVSGDTAPTPTATPTTAPVALAPQSGVDLIAPKTGVDPNEPVAYDNASLQFAATMPAGTNVVEQNDSVTFVSKENSRYYTVSASAQGTETLSSIEAQLKNSPSVKNLHAVTFSGASALQFAGTDFGGSGIVFIKNGRIYYLLGNPQYFTTFRTI